MGTLVLTPALVQQADNGNIQPGKFFLQPIQPAKWAGVRGTDVWVQIHEERWPLTYLGAPRDAHVVISAAFYAHGDVSSKDLAFNIYFPAGATKWRSFVTEGSKLKVSAWRDLEQTKPGVHLYREFGMPSLRSDADDHDHMYLLNVEFTVPTPVVRHFLSGWEWRESWALTWAPALSDQSPSFPWRSTGETAKFDDDYNDTLDAFVTDGIPTSLNSIGSPRTQISVCPDCGVVESYGTLSTVYSGQYDSSAPASSEQRIDWATPWFPWQWITVGAVGILGTMLSGWIVATISAGFRRRD